MNREGYRTPTEDAAIARETAREKLRAKYGVREGDVIRMELQEGFDNTIMKPKKAICRVKVVEIHKNLIVIQRPYPADYNESFTWWDFERRRRD